MQDPVQSPSNLLPLGAIGPARKSAVDDNLHDLITATEAQRELGVYERNIYAWVAAGLATAFRTRFTKYTLYSRHQLEALAVRHGIVPSPDPGTRQAPQRVDEIARAYGWKYPKAYARVARAVGRGQLTQLKRAGHQPYYHWHEIVALFGAPPSQNRDLADSDNSRERGPVKATNLDQFSFALDDSEAA